MKVIALSILVLSKVAITSVAIAEPIKNKDTLPVPSMAQPVELSDAQLDRITAGLNTTTLVLNTIKGKGQVWDPPPPLPPPLCP
jgi:hypothetical protein